MPETILSIDCGTQSLRTIIFSLEGEVLALEKIVFEPYSSPNPGWAEQHPDVYWNALKKGCISLEKGYPDHFKNIAGVGITTLRNTMVNVDIHGNCLRPAILWLDQRKSDPAYKPLFGMELLIRIIGMWDSVNKARKEGKCNWIKQFQPQIWEKTHKYLQVSGFLNYRLTGKFKDSVAAQIGHIPFDYRRQKWGNKRQLLTFAPKIYPVEKDKLPELVQAGETIGNLTALAAEETGLKEGLPVIACGSDKGCGTLGSGVLKPDMASLCFGTTATIQVTSKKYLEPISYMPSYPSVIPGLYNPEVEIFRGFWMIEWFKNQFAHKEVVLAKEKEISTETVLNDLLLESPPGSMGLVVQPFWSPGLSEPAAKGAMIGFGDVHNKSHIYRSIIEGLIFALLEGKDKIEKVSKIKTKQLSVSGGGSQSDEICQITADIFNLPVKRGITHETSCLGAAIITAYGISAFDSIDDAVDKMIRKQEEFLPNRENTELYYKLYQNVYLKLYKKLSPLYGKIRKITGYPE